MALMSCWVLLTNPNITEKYINEGGDKWFYEIAPDSKIKKVILSILGLTYLALITA
jgi:hypothetical protein